MTIAIFAAIGLLTTISLAYAIHTVYGAVRGNGNRLADHIAEEAQ